MKILILFNLLIIIAIISSKSPPTPEQDADAAWLSYKIYDGVNTMDTDSGYVFHSHDSDRHGAYCLWKQRKTGECYIVMRGTKTFNDIFTDLSCAEYVDDEMQVKVHTGVRTRTKFIFDDIGDKLKACNEDIIVTGHSLGGSIAHYLYLIYIKKHSEDWAFWHKEKAEKFKAVLFGTPALMTTSGKENLNHYNEYIHWYQYRNDFVPSLVYFIKNSDNYIMLALFLQKIGFVIAREAYDTLQKVSYGDSLPGFKYTLLSDNPKIIVPFSLSFDFPTLLGLEDHKNMAKVVDILTKGVWSPNNKLSNNKFDYTKFLNEEETINNNKTNDETIKIDDIECENVDSYNPLVNYTNLVLYRKNEDNDYSYILKRLLDNEKELEYAICVDKKFILKQCDSKCQCHEITKNDRPKEINYCNSYLIQNTMNCVVDGKDKEVVVKDYFSVLREIKIDHYYMMEYACFNETYKRGNYKKEDNNNSMIILKPSKLLVLLVLWLLL